MTFTVQRLVNSRTVVSGTDTAGTSGSVVLDTSQWDGINQVDQQKLADEQFDAAVQEFFEPLTKAADEAVKTATVVDDPISYIVYDEGEPGVPGTQRRVVHLNQASQILRLIETGQDNRLVWVSGGLEILEDASLFSQPATPAGPTLDEAANTVASELGGVEV